MFFVKVTLCRSRRQRERERDGVILHLSKFVRRASEISCFVWFLVCVVKLAFLLFDLKHYRGCDRQTEILEFSLWKRSRGIKVACAFQKYRA